MFLTVCNIALSIWGKTLNYQICMSVTGAADFKFQVSGIEWFPDCFRCLRFYLLNLYYLAGVSSPIRFLPREAFIARLPLASWGPGFGRRQVGLCTVEESYPGEEVSGPSMSWFWSGGHFATMTPPSQQHQYSVNICLLPGCCYVMVQKLAL